MQSSTAKNIDSEQSAPLPASVGQEAGTQPQPVAALPPPAPKPQAPPLPADLGIGTADVRTPAEDAEFQECEAIVRAAWPHFAKAGEALLRIREKKLYKNEYGAFETYCRLRWGIGHSQLWRYIAAAQVHKNLEMIPGIPLPECESQVRPLASLPPELAQQAWLNALAMAGNGSVPARVVKRAVRQVLKAAQPAAAAQENAETKNRSRVRQAARTALQELITLLFGSAERPVLIAKAEELLRLLEPILNPRKTRK